MVFPVVTTEGGVALAAPDWCLLPNLPKSVPLVNVALARNGQDTSDRVLVNKKPVLTLASSIPTSIGAPAGATGEQSGMPANLDCTFIKVSSKVIADGQGVVFVTSTTCQNHENSEGLQLCAAQDKVLTAC